MTDKLNLTEAIKNLSTTPGVTFTKTTGKDARLGDVSAIGFVHGHSGLDAINTYCTALKTPEEKAAYKEAHARGNSARVAKRDSHNERPRQVKEDEETLSETGMARDAKADLHSMSLAQLKDRHKFMHEFGDEDQKETSRVADHVKKVHGQKAHDEMEAETGEHAMYGGHGPVRSTPKPAAVTHFPKTSYERSRHHDSWVNHRGAYVEESFEQVRKDNVEKLMSMIKPTSKQ